MRAIAIDGPAGAGKSTVARRVAERLGAKYIDTGAFYRALALKAREAGVSADDEEALARLWAESEIALEGAGGAVRIRLDGRDVTEAIRRPEIGAAASRVARHPAVRAAVVARLRHLAEREAVVMDGRDIGTVVLPEARIKIFLTASPEARARRRHAELAAAGYAVRYEDVLAELVARDRQDMTRETAPLRKAPDAIEIDTTDKSIEEVVGAIVALAEARQKAFLSVEGR
ncbi:(d)CMP kinase [Hydrogenibacillus sp. N12]|uniref:(d)CMP kinase n=1 Tax=Hydrogenibacillus sp. N12 TaxID=2866627 RepID=UPI001C7D3E20|nr:(d)CMP kinase [Hydrogenibacillus sp. N12]QZA32354.1 (d)CMP kinase [Hydrogenibacillus sp. N12]